MDKLKAFFTPQRRKAIYALGGALGALLVACGVLTPEVIDKTVDSLALVTGVILALTNLLAALNVTKPEPVDVNVDEVVTDEIAE